MSLYCAVTVLVLSLYGVVTALCRAVTLLGVEAGLRLRLCSVVSWAETLLCYVPLGVCPKVCKLCSYQCFGVIIAKLYSPQRFRARKSK